MLTTADALKAELDITGPDQDLSLELLIRQWSATIERYCRRSFAAVEATETIRGDRQRGRLILNRVPVVSVTAVVLNGEALLDGGWEVEDADAGFLLRMDASGHSLGWPVGKVEVTYTAGFAAIPPDVERCCLDLCVRAYHARGRDPALRSYENPDVEKMSWSASDTVKTVGGLPEDIAGRLGGYRLVTFA
ncbi:hypothetical protein FHW79_001667 [Azospirillum sp. OGB3]|uniref:hypothetical protein n=1 Tax=Azospirillum sp. OGB3 TaxID=2587012 RepID=UPI0016059320|nr:hypothetical protein [Azospirillum sp. OGB3]MBB3264052.1 hypothetical protein [Azospirillum sp. OGB3]